MSKIVVAYSEHVRWTLFRKTDNYFCKTLHVKCLTGFRIIFNTYCFSNFESLLRFAQKGVRQISGAIGDFLSLKVWHTVNITLSIKFFAFLLLKETNSCFGADLVTVLLLSPIQETFHLRLDKTAKKKTFVKLSTKICWWRLW